jgi:hypothetical protein
VEGEPLTWVEHVGGGETSEGDPGATRSVRIQLFDEPPGKTRLELRARPYAQAEEIDARAWWDSAFSHLDNVLERGV